MDIVDVPAALLRCKSNEDYEDRVTIGETYPVFDQLGMTYFIIDDMGQYDGIPMHLFELLK